MLLKASANSYKELEFQEGTYKFTEGGQAEVNDNNNSFHCLFESTVEVVPRL